MAATPADDEKDKIADTRTRGERILAQNGDDSHHLVPPDVGTFEHIADYLFEVGPTCGDQPVPPSELRAWAKEVGVELGSFRTSAILMLSREFLAALSKARSKTCKLADLDDKTPEDVAAENMKALRSRLRDRQN